jgi:outer membrane receptor protein involved in Fe transport
VSATAQYKQGAWKLTVQERWRGSEQQSGNPLLVYSDPDIPSVAFMDMNLSYDINRGKSNAELFMSVQNVLNKAAPLYESTVTAANPGFAYPVVPGDDVIGRYFTVGLRARF